MRTRVREAAWIASIVAVCCGTGWGADNRPTRPAGKATGPSATANSILEQAGDLLHNAKSLRTEVVVNGPVKIQGRSQPGMMRYTLALSRPGLIAAVQKTAFSSLTVVSDGERYWTFNPAEMKFSLSQAPSLPNRTVDADLNLAGSGAGIVLAWALAATPAEEIRRGARQVKYTGIDATAGTRCHHLLLDHGTWTGEIWIDAAERPLIRKISWSRKGDQPDNPAKTPQVALTFADWLIDSDLPPQTFQFTPPAGAKRVSAEDLQGGMKYPAYKLKGEAAPTFVLPLLEGGQLNLASLKGSVVVLDFWATWCGPCRQGLPILNEIAREYKGRGVQVYAINCNETPAQVRQFIASTQLELPVAIDSGDAVGKRYHKQAIPETIFIDKEGIVRCVHVGLPGNARQDYRDTIDALLAGKDLAGDGAQARSKAAAGPNRP